MRSSRTWDLPLGQTIQYKFGRAAGQTTNSEPTQAFDTIRDKTAGSQFRPMPKKILSISDNDALRVTRHIMLENRGYEVVSVANLRETRTALKSGDFDLVILGVSMEGDMKREMASAARKLCNRARILELCRISPEVRDAEHHLFSAEPEEVDQTIGKILRGERVER